MIYLRQMNLFTEQKETHWLREQTYGCRRNNGGEGTAREFGTDMYTLLYLNGHLTRTYCIAQGLWLSVLWQPGWEGSSGENGYMCMYG